MSKNSHASPCKRSVKPHGPEQWFSRHLVEPYAWKLAYFCQALVNDGVEDCPPR